MRWLEPEVTTAPVFDPVSLADAKAAQRIETDEEDTLLEVYLGAAVGYVEQVTGLSLATQTLKLRAWGFEDATFRLPAAPVQSITSIKYLDTDGAEQTLDPTDYVPTLVGLSPIVSRAYNKCWPSHRVQPGSVTVTVQAGYADGALPLPLKQAVFLIFGDWYANREQAASGVVSAVPMVAVENLLANFRRAFV